MEKFQEEQISFLGKYAKIITVIAVVFGATSGIFGKLTAAPSMAIGFWRLTIALPFFAIPVFTNSIKREKLKAIAPKDLAWCFIAGIFLFGHFFTWFNAVKITNIASAAVLAALHPLVVLLVTVFILKKKVGWKSVCAILVALSGGALITGIDYATLTDGHLLGNLFAFFAALFMGLYFSVGDEIRKRVDGGTYVLLVFFSCWVCFTIGVAVTGTKIFGYTFYDYLYIVIMAVICQIGAHAVFNLCIGYVSSLYVSTWEAGEPVFSTLLAVFCLGQIPSIYEVLGCVIVVGALLYYNYQESRVQQNEL